MKKKKYISENVYDKDHTEKNRKIKMNWTFLFFVVLLQVFGAFSYSIHKGNEDENGPYFEGDILEAPTDELSKAGLLDPKYRWPDNVLIFEIDPNFEGTEHYDTIIQAMHHISNRTCMKFRRYNPKVDDDYVFVERGIEGSGCSSSVGRRGGSQRLNLATPGCNRLGTCIHEFIHAIGYYHEQSRTDRDDFIIVNWENIQPGKEHNFNKYDATVVSPHGVGYDYGSIMHYGPRGFATDPDIDTLIPIETGAIIGQRDGMSEKDAQKINNMYCPSPSH